MLIATGLGKSLTELFSGMSTTSFVLTLIGLMLIVIEFFQPSYGIPAVCGAVLTVSGVLVRMLSGGTFVMLFFMVLFTTIVLVTAHMLALRTQKKAWLTQSLTLKLQNAVRGQQEAYSFLLGYEGIATTDIDGTGHMTSHGANFLVISDDFIAKGKAVRVVHVTGDKISVIPVYEEG